MDTSRDAHRDYAVSNRFLQCTFSRLLQFGQQHPSDLLHTEHLLLFQIHHLKTPGVQRTVLASSVLTKNSLIVKIPVCYLKKTKELQKQNNNPTLIPVDPEGICARSYTKFDLTAWTYGSAKARPWNLLKPCTVFLKLVTTWKHEKDKAGRITSIHPSIHFCSWTQGFGGLLEPIPAVLGQRQDDILDKSPAHCRATKRQHYHSHSQSHLRTI